MKAKKKAKRKTKADNFLSQEGPMRLARIITYLRCKDSGINFDGLEELLPGTKKQDAETKKLIKKMSKSELENYKKLAGVGKYRPKPNPNAPKRCPTCGHFPPSFRSGGYGSGSFSSRMDTYRPLPSIMDVIHDHQMRDAYANEIR